MFTILVFLSPILSMLLLFILQFPGSMQQFLQNTEKKFEIYIYIYQVWILAPNIGQCRAKKWLMSDEILDENEHW